MPARVTWVQTNDPKIHLFKSPRLLKKIKPTGIRKPKAQIPARRFGTVVGKLQVPSEKNMMVLRLINQLSLVLTLRLVIEIPSTPLCGYSCSSRPSAICVLNRTKKWPNWTRFLRTFGNPRHRWSEIDGVLSLCFELISCVFWVPEIVWNTAVCVNIP